MLDSIQVTLLLVATDASEQDLLQLLDTESSFCFFGEHGPVPVSHLLSQHEGSFCTPTFEVDSRTANTQDHEQKSKPTKSKLYLKASSANFCQKNWPWPIYILGQFFFVQSQTSAFANRTIFHRSFQKLSKFSEVQ